VFRRLPLLLFPKLRERDRAPSAVAENAAHVLDDGFFFGFFFRSFLCARNPSAITTATPKTMEPATAPIVASFFAP
jgi:hypothetical protein